MQREDKRLMEGKLRALLRGSLALALVLSMIVLTAPSVGAANGILATYDTPGQFQFQFTVPAGVTSITVQAWGAGGAGGGSTNAGPFSARGGGGGGGGAYATSVLPVTPGETLTLWVVVGAGGVGVSGGNGGKGGDSFVGQNINAANAHVLAGGGLGGKANTAGGSPAGGAGGTGVIREGSQRYVEAGANGEAGGTCFTSCSGGGGRGANLGGYGGAGFCGAYITSDGNPGDPAGGGGGGSRTSQYNGARVGGNGAAGKVVIRGPTAAVCATLSPTTRQYDLANPASQTTTITWNSASSITSITDNTGTLTQGTHYTIVGNTTLTILNTYLQGKLTAAGQSVMLTIAFNDGCSPSTLTITAIDTSVSVCANITPITNVYDLDSPGDVTTLINWNDSPKSITSIFDGTSNLTSGTHYTVTGHDGSAVLTIRNAYLAGKLTASGQSVVLTITFPDACVRTFTITAYRAAAECITVSPATRPYDLASPGDVWTTIIDWGTVSTIASIFDGTGYLTPGTHYTVVDDTLTIRAAYLASKLTAPGQSVVLTINCDPICAVHFTILALGTPTTCASISPTARQYDLANRANQTTTITWNSASSITSITDNTGTLIQGTHYTIVGNTTLTILNTYLQGKLTAAGQSVTLTINFNVCSPSTLTITAIDTSVSTCAFISPTEGEYNLADRSDVTTLITWNDSTQVASIHDGMSNLAPGTQFTVHPYNGTAKLSIKNSYLQNKLLTAGASVTLTIFFNDGCVATLTVRAIDQPIVVGLTGYPLNKLTVMTPWILFLTALATGTGLLALRRRRSLT